MKIKLIDFGVPEDRRPFRPHGNDAGADVYMPYDCTLQPGEIAKVPLGFGIEVPDGYAGYVFPRTSMAVKGLPIITLYSIGELSADTDLSSQAFPMDPPVKYLSWKTRKTSPYASAQP